jgi:hypothetical protein
MPRQIGKGESFMLVLPVNSKLRRPGLLWQQLFQRRFQIDLRGDWEKCGLR